MSQAYLAIDLGAESGRAVLARFSSGALTMDEVHRFPNEPLREAGSLRWNVRGLWAEIQTALARVSDVKLDGIGVDAWGVDYALLDANGELLENPYHYRDLRTNGVMEDVFRIVPRGEIYASTGIQFMPINTLFQLFAHRRDDPETLAKARTLLTIPDLFHYWLTGRAACEYTNATTTQLVNASSRHWDVALMTRLGLPATLPAPLVEAGAILGEHNGTPVIAPASHDTASAVAAISARDGTAFLSSGTWSLVGAELDAPVIDTDSLRLNFTNEGGVNGTTMLLKNVMGLWMLQGCRRAWSQQSNNFTYAEIMQAAGQAPAFVSLVNPDDARFLNPPDMPAAIADYCRETSQPVPAGPAAITRCILESLALKYALVVRDLEHLTRQNISRIRVIGGGAKNALLNQFTANATGKTVIAGPVEATALGNIAVQMTATGAASSLSDARAAIERMFHMEHFEPRETNQWSRYLTVMMTEPMCRSHSS